MDDNRRGERLERAFSIGGVMAMGGGMIGADPDQLANLGATLSRQRDTVETIVSTVAQALSGTMWVGPARESFESDWTTSFHTVLTRLSEAFEMAGRDCVLRADELRRVMGMR